LDCFYNHIAGIDNFFPDRLSRQDFARDQSVERHLGLHR
jgi:hypothetical protein